jgi:DNA repair exonuclease SbcCD ATPase subunit
MCVKRGFMALFSKKESEQDTPRSPEPVSNSVSKDIVLIQKDMETMKALIGTLREMKKDDQERFQKMNEEIGELRNSLFDKEQELKDMRLQVLKAIDLVSQAQVEKVLIEKKKEDARITMLDARLESYKALGDQMMNELKAIRTTIDMYKGVEQVIALNNEVKKNLTNTNLLKADIDRHADMIEGMFVNFNKKYDEFRNSRMELVAMGRELQKNIMKTNTLEVEMHNLVKHEEIDAVKEQVNEKLKFTDEYKEKFDHMLNQLNEKSRVSYIDAELKRLREERNVTMEHMKVQLADVHSKVLSRETQFKQLSHVVNQWLTYINSRFKYYDSHLGISSPARKKYHSQVDTNRETINKDTLNM